jgi:hypothetical protein
MVFTDEVAKLRTVAGILLPGDEESPAADSLGDLDQLLAQAVKAIGSEGDALRAALATLPKQLDWESVKDFDAAHPHAFDIISAVCAGAYFMSPVVLTSIGYPQGSRRAPRIDQAAGELETGVLDAVMARPSMVREIQS